MSLLAAGAAGLAVFFALSSPRLPSLGDRVGVYTRGQSLPADTRQPPRPPLVAAGLDWSASEVRTRRWLAMAAGAFAGLLLAQGDLFVAGPGRPVLALGLVGAGAGALGFKVYVTQRTERRAAQIRAELPVVVDLLALRVLVGESVAAAIAHVTAVTSGSSAEELEAVLACRDDGMGLSEALHHVASEATAPGLARAFSFLATAHQSGGRLADALLDLAADLRAEDERLLQTEGGRRALTVYGPILALMVPVALVFLMYPTLAGLSELSAVP